MSVPTLNLVLLPQRPHLALAYLRAQNAGEIVVRRAGVRIEQRVFRLADVMAPQEPSPAPLCDCAACEQARVLSAWTSGRCLDCGAPTRTLICRDCEDWRRR